MSNCAIKVENLSKRYSIGARENNKTFREAFVDLAATPFRRIKSFGRSSHREEDSIWALKDISFEVQSGEVVGIIGRNGAGKTTLLKVLSQITEPTEGRAVLRGRVASLLEVGTGFHSELTGRENIYLSGALLGMSKKEINKKFDEIVDFSGVEKFIDTPVKRYSSGMRVRLGFAVAAHLEPEILLIDEVLAVGDVAFQKKCLGKMGDVAKEGRTVLFVSHNMEAIRRLCRRTLLLNDGLIILDCTSEAAISTYLSSGQEQQIGVRAYNFPSAPGDNFVRLRSVRLLDRSGRAASSFKINEGLSIEVQFEVLQPISNYHTYLRVFTQDGILAFGSGDWDSDSVETYSFLPGQYLACCAIPGDLLNWGSYSLTVMGIIPDVRYIFVEENVLTWEMSEIGGAGGSTSSRRPGVFRPRFKWTFSPLRSTEAEDRRRNTDFANQEQS